MMSWSDATEMSSGGTDVGGVEAKDDATLEDASVGGVPERKLDSEENNGNDSATGSAMMSAIFVKQL
jgi:hypothetical protein